LISNKIKEVDIFKTTQVKNFSAHYGDENLQTNRTVCRECTLYMFLLIGAVHDKDLKNTHSSSL